MVVGSLIMVFWYMAIVPQVFYAIYLAHWKTPEVFYSSILMCFFPSLMYTWFCFSHGLTLLFYRSNWYGIITMHWGDQTRRNLLHGQKRKLCTIIKFCSWKKHKCPFKLFSSMKILKLLGFHFHCLLHLLQIPWVYIDIIELNWVSTVLQK